MAMTLGALCAALYVISSKALLSSALAAEERDMRRALEIFHDVLTKEQEYFDRLFRDYSQWDDTQVFLRVPDPAARQAYIASNLSAITFRNYRVHASMFVNLEGSVVFG